MAVGRQVCLFLAGTLVVGGGDSRTVADDVTENDAIATWERAIAAKGGRSSLYAVRSVAVTYTPIGLFAKHRKERTFLEKFLVLPDRYWVWSDERPRIPSATLEIVDLRRDYSQFMWGSSEKLVMDANQTGSLSKSYKVSEQDIRNINALQAIPFMETKWLRPEPLWQRKDSDDHGHRAIVVGTKVGRQGYEYWLDRKTYLPFRVIVRTVVPTGISESEYELGDYRDVSGIKLPHKHEFRWTRRSPWYRSRLVYEINAEYDETVFNGPPLLRWGPKGWRRLK